MCVFNFSPAKKDDEMDPMDPSAYSDAPRYFLIAAKIRQVLTFLSTQVKYKSKRNVPVHKT